jgi:hypothetical protein
LGDKKKRSLYKLNNAMCTMMKAKTPLPIKKAPIVSTSKRGPVNVNPNNAFVPLGSPVVSRADRVERPIHNTSTTFDNDGFFLTVPGQSLINRTRGPLRPRPSKNIVVGLFFECS